MNDLRLEIVTPYGSIFSDFINSVYVPARDGEMGILPGHCDLLFLLNTGVIDIIMQNGKSELVAINWGYASIHNNVINIIADGAVALHGDSNIANQLQKAKELLESATSDTSLIGGALKKIQDSK